MLCIIDDAQWLDRVSAQTLAFVARRLLAERIVLAFGVREPSDEAGVDGPTGARGRRAWATAMLGALLDSVISGPVDAAGAGSDRGRDPRQSAGIAGVTPRALAGGVGVRVWADRHDAAGQPDRGGVLAAARAASGRYKTGPAHSRGRAGRRRRLVVARRGSARHRARGRRGGRGNGVDRARRSGSISPSARALGGLPVGVACWIVRTYTAPSPR